MINIIELNNDIAIKRCFYQEAVISTHRVVHYSARLVVAAAGFPMLMRVLVIVHPLQPLRPHVADKRRAPPVIRISFLASDHRVGGGIHF